MYITKIRLYQKTKFYSITTQPASYTKLHTRPFGKQQYVYIRTYIHTVDVERFAGLNVHGFNPTEIITEVLSRCLGQKCLLLKRVAYIHRKTFMVLLKTTKTMKV